MIVLAWNTPVFRSLFITLTIISLFTKSYTQLMPVFARDILGVGAPGLGLLLMAPGAGAIVGGLAMASLRKSYQVRSLLMFLLAGFGLGLVLFSASKIFSASLFLLFLTGGFHTAVLS
ncbi:MAG: MFS transporter, partial [Candidatus Binatia bacterium]